MVLWQESDDDFDQVSVESDDDVVLKGKEIKLYQLKHSAGKNGTLTIKNDGFGKLLEYGRSMLTLQIISCSLLLEILLPKMIR